MAIDLRDHDASLDAFLFAGVAGAVPEIPNEVRGNMLTAPDAERLAYWLENQMVCTQLMKDHGDAGLDRLLHLAAACCAHHGIRMPPRVKSAAVWHGIQPR